MCIILFRIKENMKMKKVIITILSIALVISLSFNVILIQRIRTNKVPNSGNDSNISNTTSANTTFPQELIGTWNGTANRVVEILDDGTVYWMYIPDSSPKEVYSGMIGVIEGNSFIFSKSYDSYQNGHYSHLSDVPDSNLKNISVLYNITMYGNNGFSAQNASQDELPYSFVKQN